MIGSSSAARTLSAPAHSPAWIVQPRPAPAAISNELGEVARGEPGLVAGHREADDVGVGALGGVAGDAERLLDPEVAHGRDQDPSLDPGVAPGVVDSAGDAGEVLLVAQPDERGVVGRRGQLDVDRAASARTAQVLVGDVAVVLAGPDHARGQVVGARKSRKSRVAEASVAAEQALGERDAVTRGDPPHELGRRGALEMDVELGLGARSTWAGCLSGV